MWCNPPGPDIEVFVYSSKSQSKPGIPFVAEQRSTHGCRQEGLILLPDGFPHTPNHFLDFFLLSNVGDARIWSDSFKDSWKVFDFASESGWGSGDCTVVASYTFGDAGNLCPTPTMSNKCQTSLTFRQLFEHSVEVVRSRRAGAQSLFQILIYKCFCSLSMGTRIVMLLEV